MDISKHLTPEKYYLEIAKLKVVNESDKDWNALCPFHPDKKRSFSVSKETGAWICFGACSEGGGIVKYHARLNNLSEADAEYDLKVTLGLEKTVPPAKVKEFHQRLLKSAQIIDFLKKRRGFTLETIRRFELGFDGDRVWIPVKLGNHYVNVRKYAWRPGGEARDKMLSYDIGYGEARLFPSDNLVHEKLLLCEGETDAMLACQMGYNAISVTGGAGTWTAKFTAAVAGKTVVICYDIDEAGHKGREKVARAICRVVKEVSWINLPITEPKNGDLTDYVVNHGYSKADLDTLIANAEVYKPKGRDEVELDPTIHQVTLGEASSERYYLKQVEIPVIVSGKDLAPFFVPQRVKFTCGMGLKKCVACGLGPNAAGGELKMEISHPVDILKLIDVPEAVQSVSLKTKAGIIPCTLPVMTVETAQNVEQVRIIPEIEYASKDTEYVTRDVFVLGQGVKTNTSYTMRGVTVPDPKTQYATQVMHHAEANQLSIDQFKMTDELRERLRVFQPRTKQTARQKLDEIYEDFTFNVTQIYRREDLLRVLDMVYHSVLQFKFLGRLVTKGWCEGLILGDTRCGKSETIEHMIEHYRCGELITGENTSFAGLIGGMQQVASRWHIGWGKLPLNDRRLVALDEASGLSEDQISLMSGVRSSGVAEIVKIQSEKTRARTRILWSSNTRSGRRLDSYNHGVLAIKELIGRVEDVARFDIAVTAASGEVPSGLVFEMKNKRIEHRHTSELCNQLVMWAWSRRPEHVKFGADTERAIFEGVNALDAKYSSAIPLIEPAEQRIKLARLAASVACRLFSTTTGEDVVVKPEHVAEVMRFMQEVYDKPSMGYDAYSAAVKKTDTIAPKDMEVVTRELREFEDWTLLRDVLLDMSQFRKQELTDQLGYDQDRSRELFKWLGRRRLIRAAPFGFVKHSAFTNLLKSLSGEQPSRVVAKTSY